MTDAIEQARDSSSSANAAVGRARHEIMDRIDRLQETVELVRSDARVN